MDVACHVSACLSISKTIVAMTLVVSNLAQAIRIQEYASCSLSEGKLAGVGQMLLRLNVEAWQVKAARVD